MYDSMDINEIDQIHITTTNSLEENKRVLIDIRDKYEYILGNINGSINIPYNYLALMPENYLNFSSIYYIYCLWCCINMQRFVIGVQRYCLFA